MQHRRTVSRIHSSDPVDPFWMPLYRQFALQIASLRDHSGCLVSHSSRSLHNKGGGHPVINDLHVLKVKACRSYFAFSLYRTEYVTKWARWYHLDCLSKWRLMFTIKTCGAKRCIINLYYVQRKIKCIYFIIELNSFNTQAGIFMT